jgi:cysteine desulfurase
MKSFWKLVTTPARVYLDNAATTPMSARVLRTLSEAAREFPGNPGSLSQEGVRARAALRAARARTAAFLTAQPHQVYFSHGGTDGINRVIQGVVAKSHSAAWLPSGTIPKVLVSAIEHPAVREAVSELQERGLIIAIEIPVTSDGIIDSDVVRKLLREHPETILVCVQLVNNEIGTIHPIRDTMREVRHARSANATAYPYMFCDAVQATSWIDLNIAQLGIDFLTISGSKCYGPKHGGAVFVRRRDTIDAITFGGGQEGGLVPGTEDVATATALATALEESSELRDSLSKKLSNLQKYLIQELTVIPDVVLNGSHDKRLPNNVHVSVRGISNERLVLELDARGFAVAAKSACASDTEGISHVLLALGGMHTALGANQWGSVRITMGRTTTKRQISRFIQTFRTTVTKIRAFDETLRSS